MPTAILIDDEPNLTAHLARGLTRLWPELTISSTGHSGTEALALVAAQQPDLLFLDIRMPPPDGISVARTLTEQPGPTPHIVFATAFDEYAIAAFETAAVDYLLKPITTARLQQTVTRLQALLAQPQFLSQQPQSLSNPPQALSEQKLAALLTALQQPAPQYLSWLRAGQGDTTELVAVQDVVYFKSGHKYTSAFTEQREHVLRITLKELAEQLDPNQFWQIHRSLIVNAQDIASARRDLRGRYTLALRRRKESIRASQAYGHLFKQM